MIADALKTDARESAQSASFASPQDGGKGSPSNQVQQNNWDYGSHQMVPFTGGVQPQNFAPQMYPSMPFPPVPPSQDVSQAVFNRLGKIEKALL